MRLHEITSRKDVEDQFRKLLAPRQSIASTVTEPQDKIHVVKQVEPVGAVSQNPFEINRRLDKKLKIINNLDSQLKTYQPRIIATAKEFGHSIPKDFFSFDRRASLYPDMSNPDMPDKRSMEDRHDDTITALQNKIKQIKAYLKYPLRFQNLFRP